MNILSVTKRIYKYMNDNNLIIESRENSEKIFILDERLKYLFIENNIINSNELKYTDIQIYLSRHIGYFTES
jgi:chromatin remodeling complex protein RSC6